MDEIDDTSKMSGYESPEPTTKDSDSSDFEESPAQGWKFDKPIVSDKVKKAAAKISRELRKFKKRRLTTGYTNLRHKGNKSSEAESFDCWDVTTSPVSPAPGKSYKAAVKTLREAIERESKNPTGSSTSGKTNGIPIAPLADADTTTDSFADLLNDSLNDQMILCSQQIEDKFSKSSNQTVDSECKEKDITSKTRIPSIDELFEDDSLFLSPDLSRY